MEDHGDVDSAAANQDGGVCTAPLHWPPAQGINPSSNLTRDEAVELGSAQVVVSRDPAFPVITLQSWCLSLRAGGVSGQGR